MKTVFRTVKRLLSRDVAQISSCTASKHKLKTFTQSVKGYEKIVEACQQFLKTVVPMEHVSASELGLAGAALVCCRPLPMRDIHVSNPTLS